MALVPEHAWVLTQARLGYAYDQNNRRCIGWRITYDTDMTMINDAPYFVVGLSGRMLLALPRDTTIEQMMKTNPVEPGH